MCAAVSTNKIEGWSAYFLFLFSFTHVLLLLASRANALKFLNLEIVKKPSSAGVFVPNNQKKKTNADDVITANNPCVLKGRHLNM